MELNVSKAVYGRTLCDPIGFALCVVVLKLLSAHLINHIPLLVCCQWLSSTSKKKLSATNFFRRAPACHRLCHPSLGGFSVSFELRNPLPPPPPPHPKQTRKDEGNYFSLAHSNAICEVIIGKNLRHLPSFWRALGICSLFCAPQPRGGSSSSTRVKRMADMEVDEPHDPSHTNGHDKGKAIAPDFGLEKTAPWVEKYRPTTLSDVAAHRDIIDTSRSHLRLLLLLLLLTHTGWW